MEIIIKLFFYGRDYVFSVDRAILFIRLYNADYKIKDYNKIRIDTVSSAIDLACRQGYLDKNAQNKYYWSSHTGSIISDLQSEVLRSIVSKHIAKTDEEIQNIL